MHWIFGIGATCMALLWLFCGWTVTVPPNWTDADTLTMVVVITWAQMAAHLQLRR